MTQQQILDKFKKIEELLLPFAFNKKRIIRILEVTFLTRGHLLIEDLPGSGKTTLSKAFAALLGRSFSRIQGTSDTLPQDILGGEIIDLKTKELALKKGPIFQEIVLIDEINRMHPKTQSAFLEAMEEKQVSLAGKKHKLPKIHFVLATQNSLEYEGTFPLPEAQRDRFASIMHIGFPGRELQKEILMHQSYLSLDKKIDDLEQLISEEEILFAQSEVEKIHMSEEIAERLMRFAEWTGDKSVFRYGASLRGMTIFSSALRANALLEGREFVIPEDGIELVVPFFVHRIEYLDESLPQDELKKLLLDKYMEVFKGM